MKVLTSVLSLLTLVLLQGAVSLAGQTASTAQVPGEAPSAAAVEGNWSVTPLAAKGAAAPGGTGQLLEFGDVYTTESFLAFWARTGPDPDKDWVLFSWKDGQLTRVLQQGVEFVAPDSRKVTVRADTPIHAGKHLLYFSPTLPDHIYAWDGEKLVKVLCAGDELQFGDERFTIKRARVLDASPDGKALVYWDAPGQHASGWAVHDGSRFTPRMRRGGELPGMPGVRVDNPRCLGECAATADEKLRLLEDGSVLATLAVTGGGPRRGALFRVFPEKTEVVVESGTAFVGCDAQRLISPSEAPLQLTARCGDYTLTFSRQAAGKSLEVEAVEVAPDNQTPSAQKKRLGVVSRLSFGWRIEYGTRSAQKIRLDGKSGLILGEGDDAGLAFSWTRPEDLLAATPQALVVSDYFLGAFVSYAGKFQPVAYPSRMAFIDSWVFLSSDSPRGLAEGVSEERKGVLSVKVRPHPLLYFWNGEKLSSVAWAESVGISPATVAELLERPMRFGRYLDDAQSGAKAAHISIRAIPGPIGGVSVRLPDLGDKPRTWYVPANSTDGKLQAAPRFAVADHAISLAGVISWEGDEILALTEEGLFRLRRAQ